MSQTILQLQKDLLKDMNSILGESNVVRIIVDSTSALKTNFFGEYTLCRVLNGWAFSRCGDGILVGFHRDLDALLTDVIVCYRTNIYFGHNIITMDNLPTFVNRIILSKAYTSFKK